MSSDDKPDDSGRADIGALEWRLAKTLAEIRRMLAEGREEAPPMVEEPREKRPATVH